MLAALLLCCAIVLPSFSLAQLSAGNLAPAAGPAAGPIALNINVPTNLCTKEFCLAAVPAACGGNCILTPFNNVTQYCSLRCISTWDSATVQGCLANKAAGTYIQQKLTAISNICNAGAIAAARRKAALAKYNKLFPCTKTVNATTVFGLDSCLTGTNATATNCPQACSASLLAVPPACRVTFPKLSPPWNSTFSSCIAGNAAAPASAVSNVPGASTTPSLGIAFAPQSGVAPRVASTAAVATGFSLGTTAMGATAAVLAVWLWQ